MTISETIAYLQQFSKSGKPVKDLSRMQSLLEELGNPQEQLRFVHIAGTNGKGSVVAYGSAAAIAAGIKTGQFTSPFVRHYQDRIHAVWGRAHRHPGGRPAAAGNGKGVPAAAGPPPAGRVAPAGAPGFPAGVQRGAGHLLEKRHDIQ